MTHPHPTTPDASAQLAAAPTYAPVAVPPVSAPLVPASSPVAHGHDQPVASGLAMKKRNVVAVWLGLPFVTLGIYSLVWWYKVNAEMASFDRRRPVSPALTLLAILIGWVLIVPPFVAVYRTGERIGERQRAAGLASSCNGWIGLLLLFVFSLTPLYYQSELNKIADRYGDVPPGTQVPLYV
jgi:hypothetical protein